ncbi:hypothetical protein NWFMUON74_03720 [Nocardia wallacei]|uniref:Uncharacterized protein n=1 Tax=Nocardia wallacei TaxID=480035 RepID=A0A7G1KCI5_9NOCA|nr:hypothetical protein NWFMUON74_03720 [Nocardia wallacei]
MREPSTAQGSAPTVSIPPWPYQTTNVPTRWWRDDGPSTPGPSVRNGPTVVSPWCDATVATRPSALTGLRAVWSWCGGVVEVPSAAVIDRRAVRSWPGMGVGV